MSKLNNYSRCALMMVIFIAMNPNGLVNTAAAERSNVRSNVVINAGPGAVFFNNPAITADSDLDGVPDKLDAFPFDPTESSDTDGDGTGNNADNDDDNDGVDDINDDFPLNPARTKPIEAAFPKVGGITDFPATPMGDHLEWVVQQMNIPSTSIEDIEQRFVSAYDVNQMQSFFDVLRTSFPSAKVVQALFVTPVRSIIVVGDPTQPQTTAGLIDLRVQLFDGKINFFQVQNFAQNPSSTLPVDQLLDLAQIDTKLAGMAQDVSLLVAHIDNTNQCRALYARGANEPRATGSMFKAWVLGALGEAVNNNELAIDQLVPIDPNEFSPVGTALNVEPAGTLVSMIDMATQMMGTSDNTATDHMHELVGRTRAENILTQFNHATPEVMTPFLSTNEMFHLYWTVTEADALAYVNASESAQRDYVDNVLVPFGPVTAFPQANASILIDGSWQASPLDACNAIAGLRQYNDLSDAFQVIDRAYGSNEGVWGARNNWERVWFKGGSLSDGQGLTVLTLGWLLETDSRGAFVVVGMANTPHTSPTRIDSSAFVSAMSRVIDIVTEEF